MKWFGHLVRMPHNHLTEQARNTKPPEDTHTLQTKEVCVVMENSNSSWMGEANDFQPIRDGRQMCMRPKSHPTVCGSLKKGPSQQICKTTPHPQVPVQKLDSAVGLSSRVWESLGSSLKGDGPELIHLARKSSKCIVASFRGDFAASDGRMYCRDREISLLFVLLPLDCSLSTVFFPWTRGLCSLARDRRRWSQSFSTRTKY